MITCIFFILSFFFSLNSFVFIFNTYISQYNPSPPFFHTSHIFLLTSTISHRVCISIFVLKHTQKVIIRVTTSLISSNQAKDNYFSEVDQVNFDSAVDDAKATWNTEMSRVKVQSVGDAYDDNDSIDMLTVFYSNLYRAAKYPRVMWEINATTGEDIHW